MNKDKVFKTIDEIPKYLYHGTTSNHINSFKRGIRIDVSREVSDFGQGFYLTANYKQAENWAKSIHRSEVYYNGKEFDPVVIKYEMDHNIIKNTKTLLFSDTDNFWAEFIYANRALKKDLRNNINKNYDFVYGPLADGYRISLLIRQLDSGHIDFDSFTKRIQGYKFPFPVDHQMSFHSDRAVKSLELIQFLEVFENAGR